MLKLASIILLFYTIICLFLYIKQRDLLFFPTAENNQVNADVMWLDNNNERLKIWRINQGDAAIIYFGGNAESVEYNIPDFRQALNDYTVYLVNYRGYGGSSGAPTQDALFEDAVILYDEIKKQYSTIHVLGRSLGSGVACYLAKEREVEKLALITPYDSIKNLAQSHYPVFPVRWLLKDSFDSVGLASSLINPTLVLVAEHDQVIPFKHSQNLIRSLKNAKVESHIIPATTHNDISTAPEYLDLLARFFRAE